jgi:acetyl-CoA C-acetyltransferase
MSSAVIVAAKRTAIGTFGGMFKDVSAVTLGLEALKGTLEAANLSAESLDEVIVGNILSAGLGQNIARQIALGVGGPVTLPAYTVNKMCGSGMKSVSLAVGAIQLGEAQIIAAGGTENMSRAPYVSFDARFGARMGHAELIDLMLQDGLIDTFNDYHMGMTAENLADQWHIKREQMDEFAVLSQNRAETAIESGRFIEEIIPITVPQRKGPPIVADTDEHPRKGVTVESLSSLKPAFKEGGRVTAGSSSGINDGAAFLIVAEEKRARELELPILGSVRAFASSGVDPAYMGYAPVPATKRALEKAGWSLDEVELIEINEAFAAQTLAVLEGFKKELGGINPDIVNVNGGAIALGHPIGASGARITVTLVHEMIKRDAKKGLATLCIGGGQGMALLVER